MKTISARIRKNARVNNFICSWVNKEVRLDLARNAQYSVKDFLMVLQFSSAVRDASIHSGSDFLKRYMRNEIPSDDQVLWTLKAQSIEHIDEVFQSFFDKILIEAKRSTSLLKKEVMVAIDGNDWLYYGEDTPGIVGTKPQRGTAWAYHYEVAQIADNRFPLVLGVRPTNELTDHLQVLRELVTLSLQKMKVSIFLLDRGYFSIDTFRLFKEVGKHFIMPLLMKGCYEKEITRLFYSKDGGRFTGKLTIGQGDRSVSVNLVLVENDDWFDTSRPIWKRVDAYITSMDVDDEDRFEIARLYQGRWRIETGHRTKNGFLINTTSKNYRVRLFLYMFAHALRNLWILFNLLMRFQHKWSWTGSSSDTILKRMSTIEMRLFMMILNGFTHS